ncbi:MAG: helix-turn-helix domain-containing protein [Saprospiraceae bacterium]|nr:helix-turn-helix domain-containing protein [Saprospiraceae bacterium]
MKRKEPLQLNDRQKELIHRIVKKGRVGMAMCKRLQVVLLASEGMSDYGINRVIGMQKNWIGIWRNRWEQQSEKLRKLECDANLSVSDKEMEKHILEIMTGEKRGGKSSKITLSQLNQIVALACEKPEDHGIPFSKWSLASLAQVIMKENIVERISPSYVCRILQKKTAAT